MATTCLALGIAAWPAACRLGELLDPEAPAGASELPVPGTVERLAFAVGPSRVAAGAVIAPPVAVVAVDDEGGTVTGFTGVVSIVVEDHPGEAILAGGTTRAAVDGIAIFPDLAITRPGKDYRLTAVAEGVPPARSEKFDVLAPAGVPARLQRRGGHEQVDSVGRRLAAPYIVRVTDAYDTPMPGARVHWEVEQGGGSIAPAITTTDDLGEARAWHSLGTGTGEQAVRAWLAANPAIEIRFSATAIHTVAHALVFTVQPSTVAADRRIQPPVEVTIVDRYGNVATRAGDIVTMSLVPFTGSVFARLEGDLDDRPNDGVARFGDLRVTRPGTGYRLRARYAGLVADSDPFTVVER